MDDMGRLFKRDGDLRQVTKAGFFRGGVVGVREGSISLLFLSVVWGKFRQQPELRMFGKPSETMLKERML